MAFRTILTIAGAAPGEDDFDLALDLCAKHNCHLSVLVMGIASPPPMGGYAHVMTDAWMQEREVQTQQVRARMEELTQRIQSSAVAGDVSSDFVELTWTDETIGRRARYADVSVIGPRLLADDRLKDKIVEGVLFSSGKPLLLAPEGSKPTLQPRRMMVAWDARIESSRALREALGMVASADEVRLVLVDPEEGEDGHGEEPGADAAAFLARHGAKVTVERLPSGGQSVAKVLQRHAVDTSADLLVMGAYGHSRLRERIFGGVTRSMLEQAPCPILMAR